MPRLKKEQELYLYSTSGPTCWTLTSLCIILFNNLSTTIKAGNQLQFNKFTVIYTWILFGYSITKSLLQIFPICCVVSCFGVPSSCHKPHIKPTVLRMQPYRLPLCHKTHPHSLDLRSSWAPWCSFEYKISFSYILQIRQEKPYYIADPEVDSLVSILSLIQLN